MIVDKRLEPMKSTCSNYNLSLAARCSGDPLLGNWRIDAGAIMSTGGHINRRVIVTSGIAFIGFAVVSPQSARAGLLKNLVHSVGKVTTTIVHGASSVVHEVKTLAHDAANVGTQVEQKVLPLVKTGIGLIGDAVQEAEGIGSSPVWRVLPAPSPAK
jgi:hypothetical protein